MVPIRTARQAGAGSGTQHCDRGRTAEIRWTAQACAPKIAGMDLPSDLPGGTPSGLSGDLRIQCVGVDTADPDRLATFWQSALGWRRTYADDDEVVLEPPAGSPQDGVAPDLIFLRVPDVKAGKNRLHLDLRPADQAAEVARLEGLGARRVDIGQGQVSWVVMGDPDGNEFCVLKPLKVDD